MIPNILQNQSTSMNIVNNNTGDIRRDSDSDNNNDSNLRYTRIKRMKKNICCIII
jgi:hypothetical protein